MKNIKWSKIIFIVITLLFAGFILNLITSFYGNPVTAAIATSKIETYVDETYPNMDLEVPKAKYNFKFSEYVSYVKSKTSTDTRFSVAWSKGRIDDSYGNDVVDRNTTFQRLQQEFSEVVEEIIEKEFPYETSILFADLGKAEIGLSSLTLDMSLDINNPPLPAALTIYILSKEISYEYLGARLLELYDIMEEQQIPIDMYSVVIKELLPEDEKSAKGGQSIHLLDFPTEMIKSENLIETMKEHQNEWENKANHKK
jgi:hypothetical protein